MQKKIVALAVAGLSTAAFAQTNVTIYGVADLSGQGISLNNIKDGQATAAGVNGGNVFALHHKKFICIRIRAVCMGF